MDVTFETQNGVETNDVEAVKMNDDEYVPFDDAEDYLELESLYITSRQPRIYTPGEWYDAIGDVTLDVSYNTGTLRVTKNGTYKVKGGIDAFDVIEVDCEGGEYELDVDSLAVTRNGIYKPKKDGFSSVTVEIVTDYYWDNYDFDDYVYDEKSRYAYYNDKLHWLGGTDNPRLHKVLSGGEWEDSVELPYDFMDGAAIVYKDELHIFGGSGIGNGNKHYVFDGAEWHRASDMPTFLFLHSVAYDDEKEKVYIVGGMSGYQSKYGYASYSVYEADVNQENYQWKKLLDLPDISYHRPALVFNGELKVFCDEVCYALDNKGWREDKMPCAVQSAFVVDDGMAVKLHIIGDDIHFSCATNYWIVEPNFEVSLDGVCDAIVADDMWTSVYLLGISAGRIDLEQTRA